MPEPNANPDWEDRGTSYAEAERTREWPHLPLFGVYPALVVDNLDPEGMGRVRIVLPWAPDPRGGEYQAWARVATLMAGNLRGTWFLPEVDDEVLVAFEAGDPTRPFVVGALWNGEDRPPQESSAGEPVDYKVIRSRQGVQITLDDSSGGEKLTLETPAGHQVTLDDGAGEVNVQDQHGNQVRLHAGGVSITATAGVQVDASSVDIESGIVTVKSGMARFEGVVQCDTLVSNAVVSSSYTPGAGNIW